MAGVLLATGIALSGCASSPAKNGLADPLTTGSTAPAEKASITKTTMAGKRWRANPGNVKYGLDYARRLALLEQTGQQLAVLGEVARRNPDNIAVQSYYGKQLVYHGRAAQASEVFLLVVKKGKADWKVYSALGSTLDQQARHKEARRYYALALRQKPDRLSILNNMGMSFALEGNLKEAEKILRRADGLPQSRKVPRIRQNLALVVGLQGRFEESKKIASRDLPPRAVQANLAYLKKMLSQQNTWKRLKKS